MKPLAGWRLGHLTVGEVNNGSVTVSVTATKNSGNDTATVYFAQGSHDYGESFAAWPAKTEGAELTASDTVTDTLALSDGNNCIRAFLLCAGEYAASAPVFRRILAYGDYGTLSDVYEYVGTDNNLGDPANWAKDKVAPAAAAPTAGTDIRWFGRNTDYSGPLSITDKDRFDGATLHLTGDCNVSSDVVFSNSTVSIATIVVTDPVVFSLYGSDLTTTRADQWLGVYPPATYAPDRPFINFLPGKASSFTFAGANQGVSDAATAKSVPRPPSRFLSRPDTSSSTARRSPTSSGKPISTSPSPAPPSRSPTIRPSPTTGSRPSRRPTSRRPPPRSRR